MRVYYTPDLPRVARTLTITANVMNQTGEPLREGEVVARVVAPSGSAETIRLEATGEAWGAFTGQWLPREPGEHRATIVSRTTSDQLEMSIPVQDIDRETVGQPARPEVLEEIARVSGGGVVVPSEISELGEMLQARSAPQVEVHRVQWWRHPLAVFCVIALLGLFWIGRKAAGLV